MRNFLKLLLLCLLLLISACQNSSTSPALILDDAGDINVSVQKFSELDGQRLERVLLQLAVDTQKLNAQQTREYFEKLNSQIRLECLDVCEIKLL